MFAAEVVDGKFRFLKAQGTAKVCLACHGKNINLLGYFRCHDSTNTDSINGAT
jgi:hypothetical protein